MAPRKSFIIRMLHQWRPRQESNLHLDLGLFALNDLRKTQCFVNVNVLIDFSDACSLACSCGQRLPQNWNQELVLQLCRRSWSANASLYG
jgi:hypothetical protein